MEWTLDQLFIVIKYIVLLVLVIVIPQLICRKVDEPPEVLRYEKFLLGIQNLLENKEQFPVIKKMRLGVVSLANVKNSNWITELCESGFLVKKLFLYDTVPPLQRGVKLNKQNAMSAVPKNYFSDLTRLNLKKLSSDIDAFIIDLPFFGLVIDPAIKILIDLLRAGNAYKKRIIVLDRPNPLGGVIEGPGKIPLRCGTTLGELALYLQRTVYRKVEVIVVPMIGFSRTMSDVFFNIAGLNQKKTYGYGFFSLLGALEPLEVGEHTAQAYTFLALPKPSALSDWETQYLRKVCLDFGLSLSPYEFEHPIKKTIYKGVRLQSIKNSTLFSSFNSFLTIAKFLFNRKQITLQFLPIFDGLVGGSEVRNYLTGYVTFEKLKKHIEDSAESYFEMIKPLLLYTPYPKIYQVCLFNGAHY